MDKFTKQGVRDLSSIKAPRKPKKLEPAPEGAFNLEEHRGPCKPNCEFCNAYKQY